MSSCRSRTSKETLEPSHDFPTDLNGLALDVVSAAYGPVPKLETDNDTAERQTFVMGGQSCGRAGEAASTLGLLAIDTTTGRPGLL